MAPAVLVDARTKRQGPAGQADTVTGASHSMFARFRGRHSCGQLTGVGATLAVDRVPAAGALVGNLVVTRRGRGLRVGAADTEVLRRARGRRGAGGLLGQAPPRHGTHVTPAVRLAGAWLDQLRGQRVTPLGARQRPNDSRCQLRKEPERDRLLGQDGSLEQIGPAMAVAAITSLKSPTAGHWEVPAGPWQPPPLTAVQPDGQATVAADPARAGAAEPRGAAGRRELVHAHMTP